MLTLVPIRPRPRGERRSLRTFPGVYFSPPRVPRFQRPTSTPFNSTTDAFQLHPDIIASMDPAQAELEQEMEKTDDFASRTEEEARIKIQVAEETARRVIAEAEQARNTLLRELN